MVIQLSIVFGSLLFFFCRDEDNGRADLWLSSAFFSFSVCWSVLVMKNRGWCWPLLSNLGLDFCYVCGLCFLCFSSVLLVFFFLVLFFFSRFSLSFSSVSPSNPSAFLPLCAGFSFSVPPMIFGSILDFALFCLWFSGLSFSNLPLSFLLLYSSFSLAFIKPENVVIKVSHVRPCVPRSIVTDLLPKRSWATKKVEHLIQKRRRSQLEMATFILDLEFWKVL